MSLIRSLESLMHTVLALPRREPKAQNASIANNIGIHDVNFEDIC